MAQVWIIAVAVVIVVSFNLVCYACNENSIVWRLCGGRKSLLFVSNRKDKVAKQGGQAAAATWFAWDLVPAEYLYRSPALGTLMLACYRALEFAVFAATIIFGNVLYGGNGPTFFIFFTNWTFVLFGLTGILGTVLTAKAWLKLRRPTLPGIDKAQPTTLTPGWTAANKFYHLLLETVCAASIMLTIFYWLADYVAGSPIRIDNPFKHGVSAALLLGDLALSMVPLISYHIQVVVAYGSVYLIFMWLYYAGTGQWVYRALDWTRPMACIYYVACPLLLMLGFLVMFAAVGLRNSLLARCRRAARDKQVDLTSNNKLTPKPLAVSQLNTAEYDMDGIAVPTESVDNRGWL